MSLFYNMQSYFANINIPKLESSIYSIWQEQMSTYLPSNLATYQIHQGR
jgi:hypothetical protein